MGGKLYTRRRDVLGADTSNVTSFPYFVGDFDAISISVQTGSAFASRITVQASNLDGFQSTLSSAGGFGNSTVPVGGWSHLTVYLGTSSFNVTPGPRWLCIVRPTQGSGQTASNITVTIAGRT